MRHVAVLEIRPDATESCDVMTVCAVTMTTVGAENVFGLQMRHCEVPEVRTDATEPL